MFDHVGFGVSDLQASKRFFAAALAPLGIAVVIEGEFGVGLGIHGKPYLWLAEVPERRGPFHLAFAADSRAAVDLFYRAAVAAGGRDNGAPGLRPQYDPDYYAAFVIGPDGHHVEAVCHAAQS